MHAKFAAWLSVAVALTGCTHAESRPTAFSGEWATQVQRDRAEKEAKKTKKERAEYFLTGQDGGPRTGLRADESGKPKLFIGGDNGLSADVSASGGAPKVTLRKNWSW